MKFFVALFLIFIPSVSFAYEPTQTHAGLTEQVVEFYNLKHNNKITSEKKELIIQGAIEEDAPAARATNHFYDPVRNIGINGGRTAKSWALEDLVMNEFGWDSAINAYARGDLSAAFVALGHNIHLAEDMGVPDHTRNDQHLPFLSEDMGGDSSYEDWAKNKKNRNTLRGLAKSYANTGVTQKIFPQIGEYFDFLANYSNKNFFSRDTIFRQDVYSEPQITSSDFYYGYVKDNITGETAKLVKRIEHKNNVELILSNKDDSSVLSSYFDRLALQIILSGAGVIDLFFKEGEKAKILYEEEMKRKQVLEMQENAKLAQSISQKSFFGLVFSGAIFLVQDNLWIPLKNNILKPVGSGLAFTGNFVIQEVPVVSNIGQFAATATAGAVKDAAVAGGNFVGQKAKQGFTIVQQALTNTINTPTDQRDQLTKPIFALNNSNRQPPTSVQKAQPIVFNLTPKPSTGQNTTSMPKLVFVGTVSGGQTGSGGGGSPTQVLGTQTTATQTDEVKGDGENVAVVTRTLATPVLSAPQCLQTLSTDGCLLSTTTVRFEWLPVPEAGHYELNKNGTVATTTDTTIEIVARDFSEYTLDVIAVDTDGNRSATSTQKISVATIPLAINEIAWMGTVASTTREWFEIKNNTNHTIDLSQWELNAKDGTPHVKMAGTIAPRAYIVFERIDDTTITDVEAHQIYTGALGNTGEELSLSYASTTFDQTPTGKWAGGTNSTTSRRTMERYSSRESGANSSNWSTNLEYIKNGVDVNGNLINGTPGEQNSVSTLINKGQDITNDFTLSADEEQYVVPNRIIVNASSTLTIEPGVTISFYRETYSRYSNGKLMVEGAIEALGTSEDLIIFNSYNEEKSGELWIHNTTATSTFDHVQFENLNNSIYVNNGQLEIRNSEFINTNGGVDIFVDSTAIIENTSLADLDADAFGVYDDSKMVVSSVEINGISRGDAFGVYDNSSLTVASTTISNLEQGDGFGSYNNSTVTVNGAVINNICGDAFTSFNTSVMTVSSSTVQNVCQGDAFGVYNNSTLTIVSTNIDGVDGNGIGAYNDSTLNVSDTSIRNVEDYGITSYMSTSTITNVVIENGANDGIEITGGSTTIASTTVSGFKKSEIYYDDESKIIWQELGAGISIEKSDEPVVITNSEISGNTVGIITDSSESVVLDNVFMHDNTQNVMVCELRYDCVEL